MEYTKLAGVFSFGNTDWGTPHGNPVLFAALGKEKDGSFTNFLRLIPESVDDYNLPPGTLEYAVALPVSAQLPNGMNFSPGGVGYTTMQTESRVQTYRQYHGGKNPTWLVAPVPVATVSKLKRALKILFG